VARSVAQGPLRTDLDEPARHWLDYLPSIVIGLGLMGAALAAYWLPGSLRYYNHFVWQAAAFLEGRAAFPWPVEGNDYFQDVFPVLDAAGHETGYALLPFPPLPAIVLMPVVALFGFTTDERAVSVVVGAVAVGLCWWAMGRLPVDRPVRLATTIFFGFGTVFWYAAGLGTTWFFAHVVSLVPLLAAVGLALGADPQADREAVAEEFDDDADLDPDGPGPVARVLGELRAALPRPWTLIEPRQLAAGFLFGLACTARLTIVFGAPFFMLVGGGGSLVRRSVSAGLGAALPIALLLGYNVATTGHLFHPGYEYQYEKEAVGYAALGYHPEWSIEDPRYLPQNLGIFLASTPAIFPERVPGGLGEGDALCQEAEPIRGLFDRECPIAMPRDIGMGILLTSPAYLYLLPALRRFRRSRLVTGAALAVLAIAVVNLMHFSQGWVQFGYRFSNDFVAFALPLVAVGIARRGGVGLLATWLIGASIAINFWGVTWGNLQGW
jgi:hypothetical protein